jgi:hypothetical protein
MRRFLTVLVSVSLFLFSMIPSVKPVFAKQTNTISTIQSSTPLFLQHANDVLNQGDNATQLAWHSSHASHDSHVSHASHASHFSS